MQSSRNVTDLEKKENDGWNRLLDLDNLDNSRQEPEAITATTAMYSILRHQHASMSAFHVLSARRRRISAPRRVRDSQPTKNTRRIWLNPSTDRQRSLLTHQSSQASSDRECPTCLQRHLSNIFKYFFLGYRSIILTLTLTLNPNQPYNWP